MSLFQTNNRMPFHAMSLVNLSVLAIVIATCTGCHNGAIYRASTLPAEFAAPRFSSMQGVDLSRLSYSLADSELLYPGDLVSVTMSTGLETVAPIEWKGRIAEDGTANVPLVGAVRIAGMNLPDAEQAVRTASIDRGKFVNPNVTVQIESRRSHTVTVVGAVQKPGTYQLPASNSHVLSAISEAEGLTPDADTVIEIRHPANPWLAQGGPNNGGPNTTLVGFDRGQSPPEAQPRTVRLDLQKAQMGNADVHLEDGSTIMVMQRPKRFIHVMGLVRQPDQFEMPVDHELRLLDAIALAKGRTLELADKVRVIRTVPTQSEPIVIEASVGEAKRNTGANIRLAPGDVVSVEETPATFIVGTIREFVRFGFTAGIPGL